MARTIVLMAAAAAVFAAGVLLWNYLSAPKELAIVAVLMLGDFRLPTLEGLEEGLAQFGYNAGTIRMEIRNAHGNTQRLAELASELCALKPAVLCPLGAVETDTMLPIGETKGIPVVFMGVSSPVEWGLVKTLLKPSRNVTGVQSVSPELMPKRLWWVWLLLPEIKTVSVLHEPGSVPSTMAVERCREIAPRLGLKIRTIELRNIEEVRAFADGLGEEEHEIVMMTPSALLFSNRKEILIPATRRAGVPFFGLDRQSVDEGATLAYGASFYAFGRQGARLVGRVLAGLPASGMPVEVPDVIELSLNVPVARELNVPLPKQLRWIVQYMVE